MTDEPNYATGPVDWEATAEMWKGRAEAFETENAELRGALDARFEHSDHQSAKYYKRMRVAEQERDRLLVKYDQDTEALITHRVPRGRLTEALAERDALRQQLDTMTVEWHTTRAVNGAKRAQKRLVGPWTPVEEPTS